MFNFFKKNKTTRKTITNGNETISIDEKPNGEVTRYEKEIKLNDAPSNYKYEFYYELDPSLNFSDDPKYPVYSTITLETEFELEDPEGIHQSKAPLQGIILEHGLTLEQVKENIRPISKEEYLAATQ